MWYGFISAKIVKECFFDGKSGKNPVASGQTPIEYFLKWLTIELYDQIKFSAISIISRNSILQLTNTAFKAFFLF